MFAVLPEPNMMVVMKKPVAPSPARKYSPFQRLPQPEGPLPQEIQDLHSAIAQGGEAARRELERRVGAFGGWIQS